MRKFFVKAIMITIGIMVSIFIVACSILMYQIFSSVKAKTIEAKSEFKLDSVQSLINYINSPNHSLKEKNRAVWALGQLSDERAVLFLTKLSEELTAPNGEELDHKRYICRYEVDKALKWCKQENLNLTKFMYFNREQW